MGRKPGILKVILKRSAELDFARGIGIQLIMVMTVDRIVPAKPDFAARILQKKIINAIYDFFLA